MEQTAKKTGKTYEIDMCNGPLFPKLVAFAVPLILSGILQLLFNAADIIVVGHFAGRESLAAVGSTTALINLMINVFVGLSIGANVLVAQYSGAQKWKDLEETVHTAMMIALAGGILLIFVGVFFSGPMLSLMGTPDDVLPLAALYLKIYFVGMPATLTYNFGAAILRAVGDTRRPLYFLLFAGAVNVVLNLVFVIGFSMGVAGVATATVVSECISAVLIVRCLARSDSAYRLYREKMHLTASANVEGFVYNAMNAVYQTALSFTSQNYGAGKMNRVTKILLYCLGLVVMVGAVMGGGAVLIGPKLLQIYSSDPEVISYGMMRMRIINGSYFLCGIMDTMVGGLRGLGYSVVPMLVSLTGACLFRVVWIFSVFAMHRTLTTLYISYPVSWIITFTAHIICYIVIRKRIAARRKPRD